MGEATQTSRRDAIERDLGELHTAKQFVESALFQKFFAGPINEELSKLKAAFDCEDMNELKYMHGKRDGLKAFTKLIDEIDSNIAFAKSELSKIK